MKASAIGMVLMRATVSSVFMRKKSIEGKNVFSEMISSFES